MKKRIIYSIALCSLFATIHNAVAQGTAFTYQGRLSDNGVPASGSYDLRFAVYDAVTNGNPVSSAITNTATAVSNGLFTATLDFGAGVFDGAPRWLDIAVSTNGGSVFTTLNPRQSLKPAPYAIFASKAGGVTNGAITAASIAPGSIDGSRIQNGSITSNLFAPGAVNVSALQSPYQSGRIALDTLPMPIYFLSTVVTQAASFAQSFASTPIITSSLETSSRYAASVIPPVLISGKTTSGFNATFNLQALPVLVAAPVSPFASPLVVNGRPAVAFNVAGVRYVRAQDALGQRWPATNIAVAPANSTHMDMSIINGNPAIAFVSSGNLHYVRANNVDGTSWSSPLVVKATSPSAFQAQVVSLATISGNPAIACWNAISNQLYYFRASDVNGTSWSTNGTLIATANARIHLTQISNNPAIAFTWNNGLPSSSTNYQSEVRFIRASDTNGTTWPASALTITNIVGPYAEVDGIRILMVGTNPAVAFALYHYAPFPSYIDFVFTKATNSLGAGWGAGTLIFRSYDAGTLRMVTAAMIGGKPAVAWFQSKWTYAESSNNGVSFNTFPIDTLDGSAPGILFDVQGKPALTFHFNASGELGYLRDTTPIADTFINWIAVQP